MQATSKEYKDLHEIWMALSRLKRTMDIKDNDHEQDYKDVDDAMDCLDKISNRVTERLCSDKEN